MNEAAKRLKPYPQTFRELFLKSGNLCAYPGCGALLMNEEGIFIGQLCHIESAEPGGERFNPDMTNEQRRSASNLMLMCYPHHRQTNDVQRYTVAKLREIKAAHERRFSRPDRAMRERVARLNWTALVGAGLVAGLSIGGVAHQIRSVIDALTARVKAPDAEPNSLRKELEQCLRYAPRGTIYCFSRDPLHWEAGNLILDIFMEQGWIVERSGGPIRLRGIPDKDYEHSMVVVFALKDPNQVPTAQQAVDEFFKKCGFININDQHEAVEGEGKRILRFYTPVVVRQR
jgi:hypothetical protein